MSTQAPNDGGRERASEEMPSLLAEYTNRLRSQCAHYIERPAAPWQLVLTLFISIAVGAVSIVGLTRRQALDTVAVVFVAGIVGALVGFFISWRYWEAKERRDIFERLELMAAANRLEKVIRVASQLEDHAVDDLATRIVLELKLADAEATLDLARAVSEPRRVNIRNVGFDLAGLKVAMGPDDSPKRGPRSDLPTTLPSGQRR